MVIVDEAHNLVDAVNGAHSAAADAATAAAAAAQLAAYCERFGVRLSPGAPCAAVYPMHCWPAAAFGGAAVCGGSIWHKPFYSILALVCYVV